MIQGPILYQQKKDIPADTLQLDTYVSALQELFFIRNPRHKKNNSEIQTALENFLQQCRVPEVWIHFPWKNTTVRAVAEPEYFELRTARNKNILTAEEQKLFRDQTVGIAGLSVGSAIVQALVIGGGPKNLKIADFDTIEITNLNRIQATLLDVGSGKINVTARRVWEVDPFAVLSLFETGLNADNLPQFLAGLNIFVDEMDSIPLKIQSRILCKKLGIPVVMATDNGDGIILDIERFDVEPSRPLFHGLIEDVNLGDLSHMDYKQWLSVATKIVGPEYLAEKMQVSLLAIGKDIASVPQLGSTAMLAGAAVAFSIRTLANKQDLPSGRYTIGLEEKLIPHYSKEDTIEQRRIQTEKFKQSFV